MKRSANDRIVAGVCGAIAARLGWNALAVRILAVVFAHAGIGILAYLFFWIAWPSE